MNRRLRILVTLMGDYENNAIVRTKHQHFVNALARRHEIVDIFDASLHGIGRLVNAASVVSADRTKWREHFYKNPAAFRKRSIRVASFLRSRRQKVDLILQIGALFDSTVANLNLPNIIYSDYTSVLSSRRPEGGRSPFNEQERGEWIECESTALHHAAHICARTRLVRDSLIHDYGLSTDRISVVGGGLNFAELPQVSEKRAARDPALLFVGKEFHRKGGDFLLEAFQKVQQKIPNLQLTIVSKEAPIGIAVPNVTRIAKQCSREEMAELYDNSDLFLLPSRLETWGDVLLEAMAHGLPCIGVQGQAMEEIIDEGRNGFLVEFGNVQQFADRILQLMGSNDLRETFGRSARKKVESQFLWDHIVDRFESIFHLVAA